MELTKIVELAENMAMVHTGASAGGDPRKALEDYGVPLIVDDFSESFEGLTRFYHGEFEVFLNVGGGAARTPGREAFTIAHELGHVSITSHRDAIRYGSGLHKSFPGFRSNESMEREADVFASFFLTPTAELKKHCKNNPRWGGVEVLKVAREFSCSIVSAALRCQAELPGNSTILYWVGNEVKWQRMNRDWWFELPARAIRDVTALAQGSATQRLLAGEAVNETGFIMTGTTRASWFPRVLPWASNNDLLIEFALPLGKYGALTLLRPDNV